MTGADILHHLGDAGYGGMSLPENIQAYSIAVCGIASNLYVDLGS